jgi:molybdate transport system ATP-binding protein
MAEGGLALRVRQRSPIPLDAELACEPGEILALVGPSGSGKSSLLRCIAGLLAPGEGRIVCAGETWLDTVRGIDVPTPRRRIGLVFQSYALFPHLTALENVAEGLRHRPARERPARARALLRLVHLAGLEDRKPRHLSGGQQQRVAVARALARDPHVLLLDEPFSAVDRSTREKLYGELAELRRDLRMPTILVTHDLDEAAMLADRLCILSHGATLQTGTPLDVLHRPASVAVARLVGLKNIFAGQVVAHDRGAGISFVRWQGRQVAAALQEEFAPGSAVAWTIPTAGVLLLGPDEGVRGPRDTPVDGTIATIATLGDQVRAAVRVSGPDRASLFTTVPRHLAARYGLAEGRPLTLRLRGESIRLLPPDPGGQEPSAGRTSA